MSWVRTPSPAPVLPDQNGEGPVPQARHRAFVRRAVARGYLPVFRYWMQSPWFLNSLPSVRSRDSQPPFLQASLSVGVSPRRDRKSVVWGKSGSVRVELGG